MKITELLDIDTMYYDPAALKFERGRVIFNKYNNAKKIEVDSHWKIEELNQNPELATKWNHVKAHYLILGVKTAIASRPNDRSTDWIAPSHSSGCAMACAYCLPAGTMIEIPDGSKPIEQIQDGDFVVAYDNSLEQLVKARVSGVACREAEEVLELEIDGGTLQLTPEHPVMTRRGWVEAQHLTVDDEVLCDKTSLNKYNSIL